MFTFVYIIFFTSNNHTYECNLLFNNRQGSCSFWFRSKEGILHSQPDWWLLMHTLTVNGDVFIVVVVYDGAGNFGNLPGMFPHLFTPNLAHWCPPALLRAQLHSLEW